MADDSQNNEKGEPPHRGSIQAQGGGTQESEAWAQSEPPTESEMLERCDRLEAKLTSQEKRDREEPLARLRQYIQAAARAGGVSVPPVVSKSFLKRDSKNIRIDLNVFKGMACVPDPD